MVIDFGEWSPDLPALLNGSLAVALNCISSGQGYTNFYYPDIYGNALDARCQGAMSAKDTNLASTNFAGTADKLYKLSAQTWNDVSKVGGYTTQATDRWFFTQFGNQIIATNFSDPIQTFTLNSSSNFSNLIANGSAPAGEKPTARYIATLRDFVVIANTSDGADGDRPSRVRWSPIGNPNGDATHGWGVNATLQSDYQDLDGTYGPCRQIVGGEYGTIFQERGIVRMTYVGSPLVFQFDLVDKKNGTLAPASVVSLGNMIAYLGIDGFYMFNGGMSTNIGENKVNRFFFTDFNDSYYDRIVGFTVPNSQLVGWIYPDSSAKNGTPNKMIIYNYASNATKRWTIIDLLVMDHIYLGLSVDQIIFGNTTLIKGCTIPINSNYWKGGVTKLGSFDQAYKLNFFPGIESGGAPLTAILETHDYQITPGKNTDISTIRPVVTGSPTMTLSLGERYNLTSVPTYIDYTINSTGEFPVRSNARYHRFKMILEDGFDQLQGVDLVDSQAGGSR